MNKKTLYVAVPILCALTGFGFASGWLATTDSSRPVGRLRPVDLVPAVTTSPTTQPSVASVSATSSPTLSPTSNPTSTTIELTINVPQPPTNGAQMSVPTKRPSASTAKTTATTATTTPTTTSAIRPGDDSSQDNRSGPGGSDTPAGQEGDDD